MKVRRLRFDFLKLNSLLFFSLFCFVSGSLWGQEITITDEEGIPLIGVFVYSSNNQFAKTSDEKGRIVLEETIAYPLTFKYLGFKQLQYSSQDIKDRNFNVIMTSDDLIIEEVVLIGRTDMAREDLAYETSTISAADIQLSASQTSADALQANAGVFIQKSQMGGGSPVVRGFEANKLLLVVDGVRMNNTIYRSGHLQNAITVDPAILGSMELIFGPGSLMYGSDALGGVIHFRSKDVLLAEANKKPFDLGYYIRYGSSNEERAIHADFTYRNKRFGSLSSFTVTDFNDLRIGQNRASKYTPTYGLRPWFVNEGNENTPDEQVLNDRPEQLKFTAYTQYDFLQKFKFQLTDQLTITWNNQFSTSSNIPRYDALTETSGNLPRFSSWNYGPQQRILSSLNTKYITETNILFDKVQWILAYQNVNEVRITSRFNSDLIEEQNELLNIVNTTLDFSKTSKNHQLYYGVDGNYNNLNSRAFESNYGNESKIEQGLARYPNGKGQSFSSGAYAQYYYLSDTWYKVNVGARYDYNQVDIRFDQDNVFQWPDYFYEGITNRNHSINGSVGFQADLPGNFKLRSLVGTSYRAPNIDDIAKVRLNNDEILVPNDLLKPEKSLSGELTLSYVKKRTQYGITGFYTFLRDAIVRENFSLPNGNTQYVTAGDTFNIVANVNSDRAIIQGISVNLTHQINKNLAIDGSLNILKGTSFNVSEDGEPLAHIPPTYGRLFVQYENNKWNFRSGVRYNGFKPLESYGGSVDNPEFATENGSESWYTLHATASYEVHSSCTFQVGVDNILDQFYVPFASGVPGAGRHVSVTMRGSF